MPRSIACKRNATSSRSCFREVNLLKTDPVYLETIARDRLDLMKDGETIFRIEASQADKRKNSARR